MNDINYVYRKGTGWVPTYQKPVEQYSLELNGYRVTVYNRLPEIGENGLNIIGSGGFKAVKGYLKKHLGRFVPDIGWKCTQNELNTVTQYPDALDRWCTLTFEKL